MNNQEKSILTISTLQGFNDQFQSRNDSIKLVFLEELYKALLETNIQEKVNDEELPLFGESQQKGD